MYCKKKTQTTMILWSLRCCLWIHDHSKGSVHTVCLPRSVAQAWQLSFCHNTLIPVPTNEPTFCGPQQKPASSSSWKQWQTRFSRCETSLDITTMITATKKHGCALAPLWNLTGGSWQGGCTNAVLGGGENRMMSRQSHVGCFQNFLFCCLKAS